MAENQRDTIIGSDCGDGWGADVGVSSATLTILHRLTGLGYSWL